MALLPGARAVNLGCGTTVAPGWINIDNSPNARLSRYPWLRWCLWKVGILSDAHYAMTWPKSVLLHDLRKRLPFGDGSIDYVYSSHVLEHLSRDDADRLIGEVSRILKPGGLVRLVVPDLAQGARCYLEALDADPSDAGAAPALLSWLQLSRSGVRDPHLWMYDAASLGALLSRHQFADMVVCRCGQGRVPDCDRLDQRLEDSLHLEAVKPAAVRLQAIEARLASAPEIPSQAAYVAAARPGRTAAGERGGPRRADGKGRP